MRTREGARKTGSFSRYPLWMTTKILNMIVSYASDMYFCDFAHVKMFG